MSELLNCRSCGSEDLVDLGACPSQSPESGVGDAGRLFRCGRCALGQRHPIPDSEAIAAMYCDASPEEMAYAYEANAAWSLSRKILRSRFGESQDVMVLDIGCHTGAFLGGLPASWRRHGIESAREPIQIASEHHDVTIIAKRIEETTAAWAGKFDAVCMFDVLEHLPDPGAGIANAARLLKPGGILLASSADLDAWTFRWLGSGHWYLQTPQHLSVISRAFLRNAAPKHGLELIATHVIPHRHTGSAARFRDSIRALYWGMRQRRGPWRLPHRLLQSVPGFGDLRNMQSAPWTMTLNDHLLGIYERRA